MNADWLGYDAWGNLIQPFSFLHVIFELKTSDRVRNAWKSAIYAQKHVYKHKKRFVRYRKMP